MHPLVILFTLAIRYSSAIPSDCQYALQIANKLGVYNGAYENVNCCNNQSLFTTTDFAINCDNQNQLVTEIKSKNPTSLDFPTDLFNTLSNLKTIEWVNKVKAQPLPLLTLTSLESLDLYNSTFNGDIPPVYNKFTSLKYLSLGKNSLTGSLPDFISTFVNLNTLHLYENQFSGPIPSSFSIMTNVTEFKFQNNKLNGTLPKFSTGVKCAAHNNDKLCYPIGGNTCELISQCDIPASSSSSSSSTASSSSSSTSSTESSTSTNTASTISSSSSSSASSTSTSVSSTSSTSSSSTSTSSTSTSTSTDSSTTTTTTGATTDDGSYEKATSTTTKSAYSEATNTPCSDSKGKDQYGNKDSNYLISSGLKLTMSLIPMTLFMSFFL